MQVGLILASFQERADAALAMAEQAEAAGIDGVFCYDHIFPLGAPERPALAPFPLLAAVAMRTSRVRVGTLVARVGLVPPEVLVAEMRTLDLVARGRVLAGLGVGDRQSRPENQAYGIPFRPLPDRLGELEEVVGHLLSAAMPVWIGGGGAQVRQVAARLGVTLNLWDAHPSALADLAAGTSPPWGPGGPPSRSPGGLQGVSWAGPPPEPYRELVDAGSPRAHEVLRAHLGALAGAGATWALYTPPVTPGALARAWREARPAGEPGQGDR